MGDKALELVVNIAKKSKPEMVSRLSMLEVELQYDVKSVIDKPMDVHYRSLRRGHKQGAKSLSPLETMKSVGNLIERNPTANSQTEFENEEKEPGNSGKTPDVRNADVRDPTLQYEEQEKKIKIYPTFYETVFWEIARHYKDTYLEIDNLGYPEIHNLCQVYHDITKQKEDDTETFASNLVCSTELIGLGVKEG